MTEVTEIESDLENQDAFKLIPGLKGLELYVDHDMMVYILRSLYRLVFQSKELGYNKQQLHQAITKFEKQSNLPGFLSAMSIDDLLRQLEDAQFFYPIRKREVNFPAFR